MRLTKDTLIISPNYGPGDREPWAGTVEYVFALAYAYGDDYGALNEIEERITFEVHDKDPRDDNAEEWYEQLIEEDRTEEPENHLDKITEKDLRNIIGDPNAHVSPAYTLEGDQLTVDNLIVELGFAKRYQVERGREKFEKFAKDFYADGRLPEDGGLVSPEVRDELIEAQVKDTNLLNQVKRELSPDILR